ncbi:hypothetical protein L228DRAFT_241400 [Xylona heveae TC161]|uniref:Coatomer subunit epsilon n=1 Tax=Xylona heveae (strain CBS 132557 / TC161) TaxID=1328760 RepID=A0A164ZX14_XYLHT|nr:hypothetical protein L228DRAFT_241400 [Xylona heveae TC161]KZF19642.1 hypothetical protein L228DRAFT_241400 [Xylona heveae TC161]
MDPFSAEGVAILGSVQPWGKTHPAKAHQLLNIHNAFHQGQYQAVIDFDTSSLSPENALAARVLQLRAQIALGHAEDVLADIEGEDDEADLAAVKVVAQYAAGDHAGAVSAAQQLAASSADNATVQVLAGTVLQAAGKTDEALALLAKHQGSLEAVALTVQIHLQQNRTDLAVKEVTAAKRWAQDSLLVNLAESWVGLRVGGDKYQQSFYIFEELAQAPSSSAVKSLVGQAVAELHLGRLPEAEAALQQAIEREPDNAEVIANTVVLSAILGKSVEEPLSSLQSAAPEHPLLQDIQEKSELFDKAAAKYTPKVSS